MPKLRVNKNKTAKRQRRRRITSNENSNANAHDTGGIVSDHHSYQASMKYDGKVLSVESKKDNEPIRRKKYTLKQLRREIPIAAELINKYLDGKVPRSLHKHEYPPHTVSIYPVLPNPVDLGLIPPSAATTTATVMPASRLTRPTRPTRRIRHIGDEFSPISMSSSDCSPSTCERGKRRHKHYTDAADIDAADTDEIMKLFVSEKDANADDHDRDDRKIRIF